MESVHGVDVSWLHRPNKEHHHRPQAPSSPGLTRDARPPTSSHGGLPATPTQDPEEQSKIAGPPTPASQTPAPDSNPPAPSAENDSPTPAPAAAPRPTSKRPTLSNRASQDKPGTDTGRSRKNSWISNISSKFSSTSQPNSPAPVPPQTSKPQVNGSNAGPSPQPVRPQGPRKTPSQGAPATEEAELQPYVPQRPKESSSSFFSSLTRRLSTSSQTGGSGKYAENGGVCPRRILNVDPNRERCLVPELEPVKLRRVSFSVDVEIAGGPRYKDDDDTTPADKQKKTKDKKTKERAEGEALKHPNASDEIKEEADNKDSVTEDSFPKADDVKTPVQDIPAAKEETNESKETSHKKEKKKRSEEERKERKEMKRKKAEENGSIPVELVREDGASAVTSVASSPPASGTVTPKPQDRPTTDPVRIYRRCCQLRESPILKRITEQLMSPTATLPNEPGIVTCLNLTGSRLQLADVVTLGDWLAIVPVKRLLLEDADLTDEGVRVILAGLLASKKPEPTRLHVKNGDRSNTPKEERSGMVEKIMLKNNPRITKVGWKHIALFLYMCRSIKAIDLSMIQFPDTIPPSAQNTPIKTQERGPATIGQPIEAAEVFCKALSERLGGSRFEELIMSECGLQAKQLRKIIDGATMCGVSRLGLAGNHIDDEGFEHVLQYVRSGVCHALDIGSNNLTGRLGLLADALRHDPKCPIWGLSLAYCNLDVATLKPLFPALVALPNFRFIDLSHNRHLFEGDSGSSGGISGGVQLLRRYIPRMQMLKRIHLVDVGLSTKQAIALAEILPEGPALAHLNILENQQLMNLADAPNEEVQEEACALYASLMAAVRVSKTIICIDIEVPKPDNSEVVKALAKQVVAYCLRNMERVTLADVGASAAVVDLIKPHEANTKDDVEVPEVLLHLVGHIDGVHQNHDNDDPAPDDDYIVGGTGVVKALQYCLEDEAREWRRGSTTASGTTTPIDRSQQTGNESEHKGKAKEMSKNLLSSARKIRMRLQPALIKEATLGDEMAYRRLLFLDQTLQGMIQRFEDEYPETRLSMPSPKIPASVSSSFSTIGSAPLSLSPAFTTDSPALSHESDEDDVQVSPKPTRHNSDVNIASRALSLEEGRIHRIGQGIRRDIVDSVTASTPPLQVVSDPTTPSSSSAVALSDPSELHLADLAKRMENLSGTELRSLLDDGGWKRAMEVLGANIDELRQLQERDPVGWEQFKESQLAARMNVKGGQNRDSAVE